MVIFIPIVELELFCKSLYNGFMEKLNRNPLTGREENLEQRRIRAYEGSVGPSVFELLERGVEKYEKYLGFSLDELRGKTVLDIGSGPNEIFSGEAKKRGVKVFSLSPELKHEDIRKITRGGFWDFFKKRGKWQKSPWQD